MCAPSGAKLKFNTHTHAHTESFAGRGHIEVGGPEKFSEPMNDT